MSRCRALSLLALLSGLLLATSSHSQPAGALGENFIYRVRQGDTLINIAATYTRNQANWSPLQSLNQVATPERLPIGLNCASPCR